MTTDKDFSYTIYDASTPVAHLPPLLSNAWRWHVSTALQSHVTLDHFLSVTVPTHSCFLFNMITSVLLGNSRNIGKRPPRLFAVVSCGLNLTLSNSLRRDETTLRGRVPHSLIVCSCRERRSTTSPFTSGSNATPTLLPIDFAMRFAFGTHRRTASAPWRASRTFHITFLRYTILRFASLHAHADVRGR